MKEQNEISTVYMLDALDEARTAAAAGEVPVGACVVCGGEIISRAHNLVETRRDASAHAELLALSAAAKKLGTRRLNDCILYVTLEPCAMCMGAIMNFRIAAVVFGEFDPEAGCCVSRCELSCGMTNINIPYVGGIREEECRNLLTAFFRNKR